MIFIAGISIALLLGILLIRKTDKTQSDKILLLWMLSIAISLFFYYIFFTKDIFNYPFLLGLERPLPLLQGVFLYLYVGSVTSQLPRNKKVLAFHFLPILGAYVYLFAYFFTMPAADKIEVYLNEGAGFELFNSVLLYTIIAAGIIYVFWSNKMLIKHKGRIVKQFSGLEKVDLKWLQLLTWGMGGIWLMVIFIPNEVFVFGGITLFVFMIGFFGIGQVGIFTSTKESIPYAKKEKYSKSGLTKEKSEIAYKSLMDLMNKEAIYKKNDLSLNDLASRLEVHPNYLSQIINEKKKQNFYDFINSHRVDEFKRLVAMPKNQHFTLLSLAYECGFNSKSSFNRYFKKVTNQSPSTYFKSVAGN